MINYVLLQSLTTSDRSEYANAATEDHKSASPARSDLKNLHQVEEIKDDSFSPDEASSSCMPMKAGAIRSIQKG